MKRRKNKQSIFAQEWLTGCCL